MDSAYLKEFQKVYLEKGKYDLTAQIPYLARVAEDYEQRYLKNGTGLFEGWWFKQVAWGIGVVKFNSLKKLGR